MLETITALSVALACAVASCVLADAAAHATHRIR